MKLVDLLVELEKLNKENLNGEPFMAVTPVLKAIEKRLYECDEFKGVARINFIEMPYYLVDEETMEPISASREFLGGKTKTQQIETYNFKPDQEIKFNKVIDLYSITLNKRFVQTEDISKPGIWIYPTSYDEATFSPKNQIRVIWNPEALKDALKYSDSPETIKERLLRMFEGALESMEPNIPCEYYLTLRASERSIDSEIKGERASASNEPSGSEENPTIDIPPVS